jgi:hypothetical protein
LTVAFALAVTLAGLGSAAPPTAEPPVFVAALGLEELLHLAKEKQPAIAAARASLAAAEDGRRALEFLEVPTFLVRELPARRAQASLGVNAAAAAVSQAERETAYAVTRTYFTVIYAREQEKVAGGVVDRLTATRNLARKALDAGARDVAATDVDRSSVYLDLAQTKRVQAAQGVKRGLAALREAVGLGPDCPLDVPAGRLPQPDARPCREAIIACALERRAELQQAAALVEITGLEVTAQAVGLGHQKETFAAGGDIHARQVPQESHNGEYRPGAVPPEMPTLLVGCKGERVVHARSLHARAVAVYEKTRNLIALEAEDAFLRWEEAALKAAQALRAADNGDKLADSQSKDFAAGQRVRVEDVLNAQVLASQARSQYNEFLYQEILALADLERATAGGFCAGLGGAAPVMLGKPRVETRR